MNWPRGLPEFANWLRRPTQNSQIGGFATSVRRLETELLTNQPKHTRTQHWAAMLRVRMLTRSSITTRPERRYARLSGARDHRQRLSGGWGRQRMVFCSLVTVFED